MTITPIYIGTGKPAGALPELGPGTPSLPTNPIGYGVVVGTSSDASTLVEVRVNVLTTAGNTNTTGGLAAVNAQEIIRSLLRIIYFIKQRGYIEGSGGPNTPGVYNTP